MALLNFKPGFFTRNRCFNRSELQDPFIRSPQTIRFAFPPRLDHGRETALRSVRATLKTGAGANTEEGEGDGVKTSSTVPVGNRVRIVAIVGEGSISPFKSTPWFDVILHTVSSTFLTPMFQNYML